MEVSFLPFFRIGASRAVRFCEAERTDTYLTSSTFLECSRLLLGNAIDVANCSTGDGRICTFLDITYDHKCQRQRIQWDGIQFT